VSCNPRAKRSISSPWRMPLMLRLRRGAHSIPTSPQIRVVSDGALTPSRASSFSWCFRRCQSRYSTPSAASTWAALGFGPLSQPITNTLEFSECIGHSKRALMLRYACRWVFELYYGWFLPLVWQKHGRFGRDVPPPLSQKPCAFLCSTVRHDLANFTTDHA